MGVIQIYFSVIYYTGVILILAKSDYWNTILICPKHKPYSHMSFYGSKEILANIQLYLIDQENESEEDTEK